MQQDVLVPLDGSPLAERILPHAAALARAMGCTVVLFHVIEPLISFDTVKTPLFFTSQLDRVMLEEELVRQRAYLEQHVRALEAQGIPARVELQQGIPAVEILLRANEKEQVAFVALTTHGQSGLSRWLFGGVAQKVLHGSQKPLLLLRVGSQAEPVPWHDSYPTLLVPLDGSDFAEQALDQAQLLASTMGAALILCAVVPSPPLDGERGWRGVLPHPLRDRRIGIKTEEVAQLSDYLSAKVEQLRTRGLEASASVVEGSNIAHEILAAATRQGAALIVMATHGRGGLQRLWLGSTTMRVLQESNLPVLLVPAQAHEHSVEREQATAVAS